MELQNIADGGSQHVPQIAVQQIVYLDFDGETTSYNGEILALENVEVENPSLTEERIANIVAALNEKYASQGVRFVTERPESAEYSTIFIGKTAAFDSYGTFAGLAETIDTDNQNKSDNAFVTLDTTATDSQIIATISHEADHLLGTLNHGGKGLHAYAADIIIGDGVTSTELNISDGSVVVVSSGGVANNAVINSGGRINIYSDGTANSTTVNAGGNMDILSGGTANSTTVNSGGLYIYNGVANSTTVNAGGNMEIRSGGTATHIVAASGARVGITVASNTYIQGTYAGSAFEMKDAQITGYTVNSSFMDVSSGAAANNTTLNAGGLYIYDGVANSTTVNAGGDIYIFAGGVTNNTAINSGGRTDIHSGGTANSTTVNAGGNMDISSGGAANSTTLNAGGLYIYSAGTANDTTANSSGRMYIFSGGTANSTTVNSGGWMDILSGGTANSTTINYGGYMDFSGGVANSTAINSMGRMVVYDGAANSTTVNAGGTMYIAFDGTANSTTVNNGGAIYIYVGGTATHIVASAGARLGITVASDTCIQGTYADSAFEMKDAQIDGYTLRPSERGCGRCTILQTDRQTQGCALEPSFCFRNKD